MYWFGSAITPTTLMNADVDLDVDVTCMSDLQLLIA
jgi:hypothetical protein